MNRKTELKLESMKIFTKKYILSGKYLVRNTLAVLAIGSLAGGTVLATNIVKDGIEKKNISANAAAIVAPEVTEVKTEVTEAKPVETEVQEVAVINLSEDSFIDGSSVDELYVCLNDSDEVLTAANDTNSLTKSEYDMTGKFIVATEGLNLRAEGSEDGHVLGVLNTGDTGTVIGFDGDWTLVSNGDSEGYVKSEYIIVGEDATKVAKKAAKEGKTLRDVIVTDISDDSEVDEEEVTEESTEEVTEKASEEVTEEENDNEAEETEAETEDKETEEVTTEEVTTEEVTTEEVTTEATTEKVTTEEPTTEITTEEVTTEEPATEITTEEVTEDPVTEEETEEPVEEETTEAPEVSADDLYLLAAIVYGEAGNQSYEGQLAVASVVMNRVRNGYWGSTVSDVIYAPYQFAATETAAFQNALSTGGTPSCLQAAQEALNGADNVGGRMYFLPTWNIDISTVSNPLQIGDHVFF